MKYFYKNKEGTEIGPVSRDDLLRLEAQALINNQTEVRVGNDTEWLPWEDARIEEDGDDMNKMNAMGFLLGLWMIVLKVLTLPYELVFSAAKQVLQWGLSQQLPTEESDVPVLTFITVVCRPLAHLLYAVVGIIVAIVILAQGHLIGFLFALLAVYFAQIGIAIVFEFAGLVIMMANNIKTISKK